MAALNSAILMVATTQYRMTLLDSLVRTEFKRLAINKTMTLSTLRGISGTKII